MDANENTQEGIELETGSALIMQSFKVRGKHKSISDAYTAALGLAEQFIEKPYMLDMFREAAQKKVRDGDAVAHVKLNPKQLASLMRVAGTLKSKGILASDNDYGDALSLVARFVEDREELDIDFADLAGEDPIAVFDGNIADDEALEEFLNRNNL